MKVRDGFISAMALMVLCVIVVMASYLYYVVSLQSMILNGTSKNLQSYYLAEGKIFMAIFDRKYFYDQLYPNLVTYFSTYPYAKEIEDIVLEDEDLDFGDSERNIKVSIQDYNGRRYLKLEASSDYKGLKTQVISTISIVKEFFEMGESILDPSVVNIQYRDGLKNLLESVTNEIKIDKKGIKMYCDYEDVLLSEKEDKSFEVSCFRETMDRPFVENFLDKEIFIVIEKLNGTRANFFIGDKNKENRSIKLSGIMYVEGNMIIDSNFEFNGILIVREGEIIVSHPCDVKINGMLITDNLNRNELLESNVIYNKHFIYKYGIYLPGFIEPKIELIKSN